MTQLGLHPAKCSEEENDDEDTAIPSYDRDLAWLMLTDYLNHTISQDELLATFREWLIEAERGEQTHFFHDDFNFIFRELAEEYPVGDECVSEFADLVVYMSQTIVEIHEPSTSDTETSQEPVRTLMWNPEQFSEHIIYWRKLILLHTPTSPSAIQISIAKHIRFHNFLSHLYRVPTLRDQLIRIAIMQLRDALEVDYDYHEPDTKLRGSCVSFALWVAREMFGLSEEEAIFEVRSGVVMAACLWVRNMGHVLFREIAQRGRYQRIDDGDDEEARLEAGPKYGGWIYGYERWAFWKESFGAAAQGRGVTEEGAAMAREAVGIMTELEESGDIEESGILGG